MEEPPPYPLVSVDNALRLLQMLRDEGRVRVSECADELGVARSTAHRLLGMLVYRNFAVKDGHHTYLAGPALVSAEIAIGPTVRQLREYVAPHMEALCIKITETVHLMVRVGTEARIVASVESTQALHIGDRRGAVLPAHLVSGGKAMLAELDKSELVALYRPGRLDSRVAAQEFGEPDRQGPHSSMSADAFERLLHELSTVRRNGFALNFELTEPGICAIGMCVRDYSGTPLAALCISVPTPRFTDERIAPLAVELRTAVEQAEHDLALSERR